ncbi:MAG TPA: HAD family hydrolase [Anaerolineaceae bacterium]|jgi:2-haloalkanoic acid dehalogenase type II
MSLLVYRNQPPIQCVIFDLGSTLIYFDTDWSSVLPTYNHALVEGLDRAGFPVDPVRFPEEFGLRMDAYYDERDTEFIEYTTGYILRVLLTDIGYAHVTNDVLRPVLRHLYTTTQAHWHSEEDAVPTLARLHELGYRLAILSNASDDADVQTLIDNAHLRPYLDAILTSAAAGIRKPNPRIFHYLLDQLGIPPEQAVMVGDTLGADILGAHNVGMPGIWIDRRADKPANHAHLDTILPEATISELSVLPSLLEGWNRDRQAGDSRGT